MRRAAPILPSLTIVLLLLVAACGGDDESESETTPSATGVEPGRAELEPGVSRLAEGTFGASLLPSARSAFDPISLPLEGEATPPPCDAFVFAFAWQVGDGVSGEGLVWRQDQGGELTEIGSGPAGSLTVGCGQVEMVNTGEETIPVSVHYLIGQES